MQLGRGIAAAVALVPLVIGAGPPAADGQPDSCATARTLEQQAKLDSARDAYEGVLRDDSGSGCAVAGIRRVKQDKDRETSACERGEALDASKKPEEADAAYVQAIRINVESECGKKGLTPPPNDDKDVLDRVGDVVGYLPKLSAALGALLLIGLGGVALLLLGLALARRRRASLVVRDFGEAGSEAKVGAGFADLVEARILEVARQAATSRSVTYDLDLVVADLELLEKEENLAEAASGLAEVPQLQLAVAVLAFVDRLIGKPRLAVGGELLPAGDAGHGVSVALHCRNAVQSGAALWENEVEGWTGPTSGPGPTLAPGAQPSPDPRPYYRLAGASAAWAQYEAARTLDSTVELITDSAQSFALVSLGLEAHRDGHIQQAAELYANALEYDENNVAALVNLALVVSRIAGMFYPAVLLLIRAERSHRDRHEVMRLEQQHLWRYAAEARPR